MFRFLTRRSERAEPAEPAAPATSIEAAISGEVSGQVAVGERITQYHAEHGAIINVAGPGEQPRPSLRSAPVFLRPRDFPGLVGREAEVEEALSTVRSDLPMEFHGRAGLGKTALLRHLSHRTDGPFPDGVVYLVSRDQGTDDLAQFLFDAFYECGVAFKPTAGQLRHYLGERRALVLLDDLNLERDEVEALMGIAPNCAFILASPECCLFGEGRAVSLRGLPENAAVALIEAQLGRTLTAEERPTVQRLCRALEGHPLSLIQAAALMREQGGPPGALAEMARSPAAAEPLTARAVDALSEPEQRVLALLAALEQAPLHSRHVGALTGVSDVDSVLQSLEQRGLAKAHSPSYSATVSLPERRQAYDPAAWREQALDHLTLHAESHRDAPELLPDDLQAMVAVLEWASRTERWPKVLRLVRAVDGVPLLAGWWDAWRSLLEQSLEAARAVGDQTAEAWALHQLGSRALCLDDDATAGSYLGEALELRESLGDSEGAAVTSHNLDQLGGSPLPPPSEPPPPKIPPRAIAGGVLGVAGVILGTWAVLGSDEKPIAQRVPPSSGLDLRPTADIRGKDTVKKGEVGTYTVIASDRDGDRLTYRWSVKGKGAKLVGSTEQRRIRIKFGASGKPTVRVTVSDGPHRTSDQLAINVSTTPSSGEPGPGRSPDSPDSADSPDSPDRPDRPKSEPDPAPEPEPPTTPEPEPEPEPPTPPDPEPVEPGSGSGSGPDPGGGTDPAPLEPPPFVGPN